MDSDISIAVVMLHPACNMFCSFCVTEDQLSSFSFEQAVSLLDDLKQTPIDNVVFGGGEPFTWQHDLIRLSEEAKVRGFFVQVGTNGIRLPENYTKLSTIDRYVLPLESIDEDAHNTMRIYKDEHHAIIVERLQELKAAGKSVTISTVVSQENIDGLVDLARFLKDYNDGRGLLHAWHLYKFIPEGRGGRPNAPQLEVSMQDYDRVTKQVRQMDLGFSVYRRKDMYDSKSVDFFWCERGRLKSTGKICLEK